MSRNILSKCCLNYSLLEHLTDTIIDAKVMKDIWKWWQQCYQLCLACLLILTCQVCSVTTNTRRQFTLGKRAVEDYNSDHENDRIKYNIVNLCENKVSL